MKEKPKTFWSHAAALLLSLSILICLLGFVFGVFWASGADSKYLMGTLAFMTATMVFIGVVYSKNRDHSLQSNKHEDDKALKLLELDREEANQLYINTELYKANFIKLSDLCYQKYRKKLYSNYLLMIGPSSSGLFFKKMNQQELEQIESAKKDFKNAQKDYREASDKKQELWAEILMGVKLRGVGGTIELDALRAISQEIADLWNLMNKFANSGVNIGPKEYGDLQKKITELKDEAEKKFSLLEEVVDKLQESIKSY